MTRRVTILGLLLAISGEAAGQDFSGVEGFWRIARQLQADTEPSSAEWDSLFRTPGYAALDARERRRSAIMLGFRAALMPSMKTVRDSILTTQSWTARVIHHVRELPARRAELDSFQAGLVDVDFLTRAIKQAQTLLPPNTTNRLGRPTVAFLFFLPDGRGYPALIVADLAHVAAKTDLVPFFAHEITHYYYAGLSPEREALAPVRLQSAADSAIGRLVAKLAEESLGDQHDKGPILDLSDAEFAAHPIEAARRPYMAEYRLEYARASEHFRLLDRALATALEDDLSAAVRLDSLGQSLPLEGRPLGYFMTRRIRDVLGDGALAAVAGDPLGWLEAYQRAARSPGCTCPVLSDAAMAVAARARGVP